MVNIYEVIPSYNLDWSSRATNEGLLHTTQYIGAVRIYTSLMVC